MSWFWWALGTFGIGGCLLIGAGLVFGWPVIVGTKLGRLALAIGAGAVALFAALARAQSQGAAAERARQEKENADFLKEQAKHDAAIHGSTDAALDDSLREHPGKPGAGS